jgi:hypothetical protein
MISGVWLPSFKETPAKRRRFQFQIITAPLCSAYSSRFTVRSWCPCTYILALRTLISIIRRDRREISNLREADRQTDGQTSTSVQVDITRIPPPAPQIPLVNVPHQNYSAAGYMTGQLGSDSFQKRDFSLRRGILTTSGTPTNLVPRGNRGLFCRG